ncbi:alkaline phosphatase family protein [Mycolicibacter minnesotensis]
MTTLKQVLCGAAITGLVAGTSSVAGAQAGISTLSTDWMLAAEHVLLIGVDGANFSKVLEYAYTPDSGFKTAMDQGITGTASLTNHMTMSGPAWSTILTGVWDDKHGVINNLFRPEVYSQWPSVFNLIEYHRPDIETTIIGDWEYLNELAAAGNYPADNNVFVPFQDSWATTDSLVVDHTIDKIMATLDNPDDISSFLFSYQVQADEAGHSYGSGSEQFEQAIINVGGNIQQILAAIAHVKAITGDDWSVIITTDHGHQQNPDLPGFSFGHGFQSPNETTSFVIFDQAGQDATDGTQNLNYSITDITPTILALFGIALRSDFDGSPLFADPAITDSHVTPEDLKQALLSAIAMYGYPNIGNEISLAIRTVAGAVPYGIDLASGEIDKLLQGIVDQDIFLISGLAHIVQHINSFFGGMTVDLTSMLARGIGYLTGAGVIAPTDAPLPIPPGSAEFSGSAEPLPVDAVFAASDVGDSDLPGLLDITALAG